jgi:adenine-specific DNA glycosylase
VIRRVLAPVSPLGLVQELPEVRRDPWRVLVASILRVQVAERERVVPVLLRVLERWPTDANLAQADELAIAAVVEPLGLQRRRAHRLARMSLGYLMSWHEKAGATVADLEGVGQYGSDAWSLFVDDGFRYTHPSDRELRRWKEWRSGCPAE